MKDSPNLDIRSLLGLEDAFASYEHDPSRIDRQGWNSRHGFFETAIQSTQPRLIIELGVWKGMSCLHMANLMEREGIDGQILAIDTWLGSSNHLSVAGRRSELKPVDGYPSVYRTFLANVFDAGHSGRIVPLPMDGTSAAFALKRLDVKAEVIHIDASHEYEAALADFRNYWPLLGEQGILIVDDYGSWPGVTRAACEFAAEVDRPLFGSMAKAMIPKAKDLGFEMIVTAAKRYKRMGE